MTDRGSGGGTASATSRPPLAGLAGPLEYQGAPPPGVERLPAGRAWRFWSDRRLPAALIVLGVLAATGLSLYQAAAVPAGLPAWYGHGRLVALLTGRQLSEPWVRYGATVAIVVGAWLIWLAVTPGQRAILPMGPPETAGTAGAAVRGGLERAAAGLVVRDRMLQVAGVRWVSVRVGRRRITVRAESHFRELDEVRRELDAVLADALYGLGLDRPLQPALRLRRGDGRR